jgi:hypothetical protein
LCDNLGFAARNNRRKPLTRRRSTDVAEAGFDMTGIRKDREIDAHMIEEKVQLAIVHG